MRLITSFQAAQWLTFFCCWGVAVGKEPAALERPYELGPLTISEFIGRVEPGSTAQANTATRVRSKFRYSIRRSGRHFEAKITSITLFTVFLPQDSWWASHASTALLDHEQGHFDIAEINVRKAQLAIAQSKSNGKSMMVTKNSKQEASAAVVAMLDEQLQQVDSQIAADNLEYDRDTRHGLSSPKQSELRRIHQLTLEHLAEELAARNPKTRRLRAKSAPQ
ncbi:DUF922 domain-containing protein [Aureliella helgolandensis]|uniref:DUF922 domain-containing protein n=1 Tax=Aureliella helgolandensis TaxID=2527968 RepID=A0A518G7E1_9BACT|nr:hypothetical protein [Aureliella helgolandensis]QDV24499.1 hypothetical protein Q31a_28170 [Aureliella helgolandensis]